MSTLAHVLVAALLCASALAHAAPAERRNAAREHHKLGLAAYALGDFAQAAVEYEAAFKLEPDPALLFNAAQAHRRGGNPRRALELYESYLRVFHEQVENRADIERRIAELKSALAARRAAPAVIQVAPADIASPAPVAAPRKSRAWAWGLAIGLVATAGAAVGIGVGLGLSPHTAEMPTMGVVTF